MNQLVRDSSDRLLGAPHRAEIAAAIGHLTDDVFGNADLIKELRQMGSDVRGDVVCRNLAKLVAGGALKRLDRGRFERQSKVYWPLAEALLAETQKLYAPAQLRSTGTP